MRTDDGIMYMGITIIVVTALCFLCYFPESGAMLCRADALKGKCAAAAAALNLASYGPRRHRSGSPQSALRLPFERQIQPTDHQATGRLPRRRRHAVRCAVNFHSG